MSLLGRTRLAVVLGPALLGLGCSSSVATSVTGIRAFDVVATIEALPQDAGSFPDPIPRTAAFTLVLDPEKRLVLTGSGGQNAAATIEATGANTFKATQSVSAGLMPFTCSGLNGIRLKSVTFTVDGERLRGEGTGDVYATHGDYIQAAPIAVKLSGGPDVTPPRLLVQGEGALDPLAPLTFVPSEPLPVGARARLTAGDGSFIDLLPHAGGDANGDPRDFTAAFAKPDVVLGYGTSYAVGATELVDFAGHGGEPAGALRIDGAAVPPLVEPDFWPRPVAGTLVVRVAVPPGATKLRLSYRVTSGAAMFVAPGASVVVGSVGKTPAAVQLPPVSVSATDAGSSEVKTTELVLPADAAGELVVQISIVQRPSIFCPPPFPASGMNIEDLRLE
jgi:hypothetical protein